MRTADRLTDVVFSPIRAISEDAPGDAIPMGLGEPSWDMPEPARRVLARQQEGPCPYGHSAGLTALREAVGAFHGATVEEVMLGSGSQGVLYALVQTYLNPGEALLVPDPGFVVYTTLAHLAGGEAVGYPMSSEYSLDPGAFLDTLDRTPNAKMAIVNHPSNPTGGGTSAAALAEVAEICAERGILLLSDEVYRNLCLGKRQPSLREVSDKGLVLGSVSKAWGAPGLRVGWAIGDPALLAPARLVHLNMVTCLSLPSQLAAIALLEASATVLEEARDHLRVRWEAFSRSYTKAFGSRPHVPAGGFYHWQRLPPSALSDPVAFCHRLRDEGRVLVVPGISFGDRGRGHVRISYAGDPGQIEEGVARLAPYWRES